MGPPRWVSCGVVMIFRIVIPPPPPPPPPAREQATAWDDGVARPDAMLPRAARVTHYTTNPAFVRADVVPIPLGLRDHLAGAYAVPWSARPIAPKPSEVGSVYLTTLLLSLFGSVCLFSFFSLSLS